MNPRILLLPILLTGCTISQPKVYGPQTAGDYYATLKSNREKEVFNTGVDYANTDMVNRLYAAEHNIQAFAREHSGSGQKKEISLRRNIYAVPVPGYQEVNGVKHDGSYQYVELPTVE